MELWGDVFGLRRRGWSDNECRQGTLKEILWKVGMENEEGLTIRGSERQLDAGKDDDPLLIPDGLPGIIEFVMGRPLDVWEESEIVMIRDSDRRKPLLSAGED